MKVIEFEWKDLDAVKGEIEECLAETDEFPAARRLAREITQAVQIAGVLTDIEDRFWQSYYARQARTRAEAAAINRPYGESPAVDRSEVPAAESPARARGAAPGLRPPRDR